MTKPELGSYFYGLGYRAYLVEGEEKELLHKKMYYTLNKVIEDFEKIKKGEKTLWPMIILKTPKGWTGPKIVNGNKIEGTFKAHQVPLQINTDEDVKLLENWLKSYHPENLFDENGTLTKEIRDFLPKGDKRMGANPNANGGKLLKELNLPNINNYEIKIERGITKEEDMHKLSEYLRDVYKNN